MRSTIAAVLVALSTLVAVPAFAHGHDKATFPMAAAAFKQKVDERVGKARQHMESQASKLPADKAKEVRAKFEAVVTKVNQEVAKATADGTVTKEEAKKVREVARELGHGGHARHARGRK